MTEKRELQDMQIRFGLRSRLWAHVSMILDAATRLQDGLDSVPDSGFEGSYAAKQASVIAERAKQICAEVRAHFVGDSPPPKAEGEAPENTDLPPRSKKHEAKGHK